MKTFCQIFLQIFLVIFLLHQSDGQQNGTAISATNGQIQIKVGLLSANGSKGLRSLFGFGQTAPAITLALRRANEEHLVDRLNFTFSWLMCDCFQPWSIGYTNQLILEQNVDALIGPPCVTSALVAGYGATFYNLPLFLWGPTVSSDLNNDTLYPTVFNTNVNSRMLAMAVRSILGNYNWSEVSFVYTPDDQRMVCQYFYTDFIALVNDDPNVTIVFRRKMDSSAESMRSTLIAVSNRSRIVITCFDNINDRRQFLLAVTDLGLAGKNTEFAFIIGSMRGLGMTQPGTTVGDTQTADNIPMWVQQDGLSSDGRDNDALIAARRFIVVDLENQSYAQLESFNRNMSAEFGKPPFNCARECMGGPEEQTPANYARSLFDSAYMYFLALNRTMDKYGISKEILRNGTLVINVTASVTFKGQTGTVVVNAYGNRRPIFFATMLDGSDTPKAVINITIVQQQSVTNVLNNGSISAASAFETIFTRMYSSSTEIWVNYGGIQPLTRPRCGYSGNQCPQDIALYIYSGGGLILLLFIATGGAIGIAIRAKFLERDRLTRECLIPFAELRNMKELRSAEELNSETGKSMRSMHSSASGGTKVTLGSNNKKLETDTYAHFLYNREIVFGVKYLVKVRIDAKQLGQLRKLRFIDHDNLNKFYGICTDAPILYAIWKHCQRGSLKNLIAKEQYVGDVFVMVSLMRDITNGLSALHQTFVGAHGSLSSENCLINDRWQVKISDFGLNLIRESQPMPRAKLLWTAPEHLRQNNRAGTVEGDVYSFAIICTELVNRETVWNGVEREQDIDEILYRLKRSNVAIPHRPQIRANEAMRDHQSLIHLVRDCWAENPSERPKMERVRTILRQLNRDGNTNSLMDYVFGMLEQYASSLEQEVEERTKELVEEKRKSDILLYRMLPRQVAEKLKLGESVEPESFLMATVLFSDVVSFTTLASKCTPLQVVNLLNNLYTTFDNIIDTYDTYKVETIGDGYLVCSGIPKRNGDNHAREIAELAFAFLRAVSSFRIDHLHAERVNLRIGFHTGPAVAGVVGLTMPRYCLFGDTVNTASRMESNGKPAHIHISNTSNHYLKELIGGYVTESRGEVIIKGKGVMETFWLLGHSADAADSSPMYRAFVGDNTSQ